jgi:hypothetical protein
MSSYIEFHKRDVTLAFAFLAAVCAYYAWIEAMEARHAAQSNRDPIEVDSEATDLEDVEDADD